MKTLFKWWFVVGVLLASLAVLAEPSSEEIYKVAKSGDLQKANVMIEEVLAAHPKSAKAHFIKAQLDAAQGKVNQARTELAVAESLASDKPFASPQAIAHLKAELDKTSGGGSFSHKAKFVEKEESGSNWMTWLIFIVVVLIVVAIVRAMMRPKFQPVGNNVQGLGVQGYGAQGYGNGQPNMGPGYGPTGGGMGSSIMGGLATGAAIGAGVVAGEALMHKVMGDDHPAAPTAHQNNEWTEPEVVDNAYDMGGDNFGASDGGWDSGGSGGDDWS